MDKCKIINTEINKVVILGISVTTNIKCQTITFTWHNRNSNKKSFRTEKPIILFFFCVIREDSKTDEKTSFSKRTNNSINSTCLLSLTPGSVLLSDPKTNPLFQEDSLTSNTQKTTNGSRVSNFIKKVKNTLLRDGV